MIQAETEKQKQIEYLQKLMELPNAVSSGTVAEVSRV